MRLEKSLFPSFVFLGLVILEVTLRFFDVPRYLVPKPSEVGFILWDEASLIGEQFLVTALEWGIGILLSVIVGVGLAVSCFKYALVRSILNPFLIISQSVPYLTFAPLLLIWLGLGMLPKIVLIVLSCAFPIALVVEDGLVQARKEYEVVVAMLKFRWWSSFLHVYFPAALPNFFSGLKISVSYAFVSSVLSELIGSAMGLGVYMTRAQQAYRTDRVLAAVVVIVATSLLSAWLVDRLRRKVVFWENVRK